MKQGGSRRGLPQSFLNRFVQVHIRLLNDDDYFSILKSKFPRIPRETLRKMIEFNAKIRENQPPSLTTFEFNLRDLCRWCEAAACGHPENARNSPEKTVRDGQCRPESAVELIYCARVRNRGDRARLRATFAGVFGREVAGDAPVFYANRERVFAGDASLSRGESGVNANVLDGDGSCVVLRRQLAVLRDLMCCVRLNWMSILVSSLFLKIIVVILA